VLALAVANKLTRGRKLRMDGMVVETNIHYPTDSSLLGDGVRVLGRTLSRAKAIIGEGSGLSKKVFRNRTRSARHAVREIQRLSRLGKERVRSTYRRLVQTAGVTVRQAEQVLPVLQEQETKAGEQLTRTLQTVLPFLKQVLEQTVHRVFENEPVPAEDKVVSIFEPHSDIIRRGKPRKSAEFGHKVWLGEVEGGFIAQYSILDGNPADKKQWQPSLERHVKQFGHPPWQASGDRGVHSADNEVVAEALGVQRIALPKPGHKSKRRREHEKQRWFRRGRRFHAGVEGRISVISRKCGMDRCRNPSPRWKRRSTEWEPSKRFFRQR
jgi:IS5 family transposase